jgi:hypothetical protein
MGSYRLSVALSFFYRFFSAPVKHLRAFFYASCGTRQGHLTILFLSHSGQYINTDDAPLVTRTQRTTFLRLSAVV